MNSPENEKILKVVGKAMQTFNEQLPANRKLMLSPECQLVGAPDLDSAEIVNLMVGIEQQVEQDLGISVTLFDSIEQFVSVQTVVDFIAGKIRGGDVPH